MALDAVTATGNLIVSPLASLWFAFIKVLPGIVAAIIVLIVGYFIALGLGSLVRIILVKAGLDQYYEKGKFAKAVGHLKVSHVLGEITKWYVFIVFLQAAVDLLSLGAISTLLSQFVAWLPSVVVAAIIILFGITIAHYVSQKIEEHTEVRGTKFFSKMLKIVILVIVFLVALENIGVNVSLIENMFLLLIAALAIGIAIALGIGLGGALKNESRGIVDEIKGLMKH